MMGHTAHPSPPPHNLEAEQAVLGALILHPEVIVRLDGLHTEHFYQAAHRLIYQAILDILDAGDSIDTILLSERLKRAGALEDAGGLAYLVRLTVECPGIANVEVYTRMVRRQALLRALQAYAAHVTEQAASTGADPETLIDAADQRLTDLMIRDARHELGTYGGAVGEAVDWIEAPEQGISTGYSALDAFFRLVPGELVVLAGRPSMGKSALALNIVERVAIDHAAAIFSFEMSRRQVAARSLRWHEDTLGRGEAIRYLHQLKLWINDPPTISVGQLRQAVRRLKRRHGLKLVMVDYLQLMTAEGENRTKEIGAISRGLKAIAQELDISVIAVSQLSRASEARSDRRPIMSDLRESGEIEQDADVVAMVYRDEYYNEDSPSRGFAECIVRKHREGPTGTAWLRFLPKFPRFLDYTGEAPRPAPERKRSAVVDFKQKRTGEE